MPSHDSIAPSAPFTGKLSLVTALLIALLTIWVMVPPVQATKQQSTVTSAIGLVPIGQYAVGVPSDIQVVGTVAYVTDSPNSKLITLDVQNPASPTQLGSVSLPAAPSSVTISANRAYVNMNMGGIGVIDIQNPQQPQLLTTYLLGVNEEANDLAALGNRVYIVQTSAWRIVDLSNPQSPVQLFKENVGGAAIRVANNRAYIISQNELTLRIIDVTNPQSPQQLGTFDNSARLATIAVNGNYVAIAGQKQIAANPRPPMVDYGGVLVILDVSNPQNPTVVFSTTDSKSSLYAIGDWEGKYLAVSQIYDPYGTTATTTVFDTTVPTALLQVATTTEYDQSHLGTDQLEVHGSYLYSAKNSTTANNLRIYALQSLPPVAYLPMIQR